MKSEVMRISHQLQAQKENIQENAAKIKVNKTLPYLVSSTIELLDIGPQEASVGKVQVLILISSETEKYHL